MKRALLVVWSALAIVGASAPALAQYGAYEPVPRETRTLGDGRVRISGHARTLLIPETYTVQPGDTLWDVTGRYYGNPWEWPRVWSYNPEITNPHWIYPLDQIRLLAPDTAVAAAPAPTTTGPRIVRSRRREAPGTIFLRQEGYLDRDALEEVGVIVGSPADHMMLAPYDTVYVEYEEGMRGEPRGEYAVFREIPQAERAQGEQGTLVRILGAVRIDSYDPQRRTARATIVEALDPIERGFRIAPIPRQFDIVPPRPADRNLATTVVATLRPRELLGDQQVVFVPVGREEGVALGNRFFIVRSGDGLSSTPAGAGATEHEVPPPSELPDEIIAEALVVHVRPHSATLMITRSLLEVRIGDRAEMRAGY